MNFHLTILGSNSAMPNSERFPTAHALNACERFFLIDCGEGTQIHLRQFRVKFSRINHVFISHLHGDHFFGIFGLLSTYNLLGRTNPLHIHSHSQLRDILNCQSRFLPDLNFELVFHDLPENKHQILMEDDRIQVETFPLAHRIPTNGFIFKEKIQPRNIKKEMVDAYQIGVENIRRIKEGEDLYYNNRIIPNHELTLPPYKPRSYAFCSDTKYNEDIIPYVKNVDLLYHEATFREGMGQRAKETYHSTNTQAAYIAKKAGVKKLIIGHYSARYKKEIKHVVEEARKIFPETYPAQDGDIHYLDRKRMTEEQARYYSEL